MIFHSHSVQYETNITWHEVQLSSAYTGISVCHTGASLETNGQETEENFKRENIVCVGVIDAIMKFLTTS